VSVNLKKFFLLVSPVLVSVGLNINGMNHIILKTPPLTPRSIKLRGDMSIINPVVSSSEIISSFSNVGIMIRGGEGSIPLNQYPPATDGISSALAPIIINEDLSDSDLIDSRPDSSKNKNIENRAEYIKVRTVATNMIKYSATDVPPHINTSRIRSLEQNPLRNGKPHSLRLATSMMEDSSIDGRRLLPIFRKSW